jgi:lysozyme family protein
MSLFGAPQVATLPGLPSELPTPLAVAAPAGGELARALPSVPAGLPTALVALAAALAATAGVAHAVALRARRVGTA